jgi:hypothetical protein
MELITNELGSIVENSDALWDIESSYIDKMSIYELQNFIENMEENAPKIPTKAYTKQLNKYKERLYNYLAI